MVIKRHYKVIILKDNEPVGYCYSNTLAGVLDYITIIFNQHYIRSHNLQLTFKIIRYEFGNDENYLAEDLPTP